jgi:hypothetical protein
MAFIGTLYLMSPLPTTFGCAKSKVAMSGSFKRISYLFSFLILNFYEHNSALLSRTLRSFHTQYPRLPSPHHDSPSSASTRYSPFAPCPILPMHPALPLLPRQPRTRGALRSRSRFPSCRRGCLNALPHPPQSITITLVE